MRDGGVKKDSGAGDEVTSVPPLSKEEEERDREIEGERQKGKTDMDIIRELKQDLK